jgi:hypothetical protein
MPPPWFHVVGAAEELRRAHRGRDLGRPALAPHVLALEALEVPPQDLELPLVEVIT